MEELKFLRFINPMFKKGLNFYQGEKNDGL